MIDFEKLAEAYELAYETNHCLSAEIRMIEGAYACAFHLLDNVNKTGEQYFNISALLEKLIEKKHPSSKYKVGQTVWRLNDEYEPHSLEICDIDLASEEMYLDTEDASWWMEEQLYASKQELIEAQIEYWQNLQLKDQLTISAVGSEANIPFTNCQHESDGHAYHDQRPGESMLASIVNGTQKYKCLKCGEFYR